MFFFNKDNQREGGENDEDTCNGEGKNLIRRSPAGNIDLYIHQLREADSSYYGSDPSHGVDNPICLRPVFPRNGVGHKGNNRSPGSLFEDVQKEDCNDENTQAPESRERDEPKKYRGKGQGNYDIGHPSANGCPCFIRHSSDDGDEEDSKDVIEGHDRTD